VSVGRITVRDVGGGFTVSVGLHPVVTVMVSVGITQPVMQVWHARGVTVLVGVTGQQSVLEGCTVSLQPFLHSSSGVGNVPARHGDGRDLDDRGAHDRLRRQRARFERRARCRRRVRVAGRRHQRAINEFRTRGRDQGRDRSQRGTDNTAGQGQDRQVDLGIGISGRSG